LNPPPTLAPLGRTEAGCALSGSPQLASKNAGTINSAEHRDNFIPLFGCRVTLLNELFAVPGDSVQHFFGLQTPNHHRAPMSRQLEIPMRRFMITRKAVNFVPVATE
jgi:hypothetical protein